MVHGRSMARTSKEEWQEVIGPCLAGINRYNPENIETLEQYVQFQGDMGICGIHKEFPKTLHFEWIETIPTKYQPLGKIPKTNLPHFSNICMPQAQGSDYDFEANLTLMKLYQFQPSHSNISMAVQILLKALANLPRTDFVLLKSVLPLNLQQDPTVQEVLSLHALLESCEFKQFWTALRENRELVELVSNTEEAVRSYICSIVNVSYQTVRLELLSEYLGSNEAGEVISAWGWQQDGETVHIQNQEEHIKPKKILAKIELDSVSGILAAAARV